jgi:hypothetical protein
MWVLRHRTPSMIPPQDPWITRMTAVMTLASRPTPPPATAPSDRSPSSTDCDRSLIVWRDRFLD